MKKKILLGVIAGVLTLTLGTATAFAASENFTDQNSDGVCDNFQSTTRPLDGTGNQNGQCGGAQSGNFTDQNGDGVCDNYQSTTRPQDGTGNQNGQFGGAQNGSGNGNGNQYGKK